MENLMDIFPALLCPATWGKLMVCTDASDEGQNAVAAALELAQACDSQVFAVQVLQIVPEFQAVVPDLRAALGKGVQENMAVIKAAADKLGVALKTVTPQGQLPHATIVATADELRPTDHHGPVRENRPGPHPDGQCHRPGHRSQSDNVLWCPGAA